MIARENLLQSGRLLRFLIEFIVQLRAKLGFILVFVGVLGLPIMTCAQTTSSAAPALTANASAPSKGHAPISKPHWSELTPVQQQALRPLALSWSSISEPQKRKWLEISKNYFTLQPADQATMHSRMNEWVMLSPQQRAQARLNYAKTNELSKQLSTEEKKAKWLTYQALSAEEKDKLVAKGTPKSTGAATAVKPVAPQKLTVVPKIPVPSTTGKSSPAGSNSGDAAPDIHTPPAGSQH